MLMTDQGTVSRSFSKQDLEKFLKEWRVTKDGGRLGTLQSTLSRIGRWSEMGESRTEELEIGMSEEARKRSRMEFEVLEYRVGRVIGWVREWEVMKLWKSLA